MSAREVLEQTFKNVIIRSVAVCEQRCVGVSGETDLSNFEKSCLGKCFDKYYAVYERNVTAISQALHEKTHNEYDQNF